MRTKKSLIQLLWWLYAISLCVIPFLWSPLNSELFEFPKMHATYIWATLALAGWLVLQLHAQTSIYRRRMLDLPILMFLLSQSISTILSMHLHTSIFGYYSRLHGGLLSTLSYTILYFVASQLFSRKQIIRLLFVLIFAAGLTSLYSFPEHFGHSPSCLFVTGQFDVSCWIQDVQERVYGTFGQPNWQAAYIISVIFLPLAACLIFVIKKPKEYAQQMLFLIVFSFLFAVLLFTKSRSALLGFGLGMLAYLGFLGLFFWKRNFAEISWKRVAGYIAVIFVCMYYLLFVFGSTVTPQIKSFIQVLQATNSNTDVQHNALNTQQVEQSSLETEPQVASNSALAILPVTPQAIPEGGTDSSIIRKIVWRGALDIIKQYPLFGSGTATFAYAYNYVRPMEHNMVSEWDFLYNKAHNEWLDIAATTGLFGIISYLSIYVVLALQLARSWSKQSLSFEQVTWLAAIAAGLLALQVSNLLGFSTVSVAILTSIFLAASQSLLATDDNQEAELPEEWQTASTRQNIALMLIAFFTCYAIYSIWSWYRADIYFSRAESSVQAGNLLDGMEYYRIAQSYQPNQVLYADQMSVAVARAAVSLAQQRQATAAAQLALQAETFSQIAVEDNPHHLNYWKTRARVYNLLAALHPDYIQAAIEALESAHALAPSNPKIIYNLGLLHQQAGDLVRAENYFMQAISMKANYDAVYQSLAELYETKGEIQLSLDLYTLFESIYAPDNERILEKIASLSAQLESSN